MPESTHEERTKVARDECSIHGHTYDVVKVTEGYPVKLVCTNCGSSWRLHPDDHERFWGTEWDEGSS